LTQLTAATSPSSLWRRELAATSRGLRTSRGPLGIVRYDIARSTRSHPRLPSLTGETPLPAPKLSYCTHQRASLVSLCSNPLSAEDQFRHTSVHPFLSAGVNSWKYLRLCPTEIPGCFSQSRSYSSTWSIEMRGGVSPPKMHPQRACLSRSDLFFFINSVTFTQRVSRTFSHSASYLSHH